MVDRRNRHLKKNGTNFGWSTHALYYNNTPFALKAVDGDVVVCVMYLNHSCMYRLGLKDAWYVSGGDLESIVGIFT